MAKGAATEKNLGNLHSTLTTIFTKVLENELDQDIIETSPAMLSAIAKFLKDNDISYDSAQIDELSELEQKLKAKKASRPDFSNVTALPLTGTE